ncbi:MAG TPA: Ig-like domain-containing protein [Bacteroidales bacterium]|nr:Ig-like domain-containing protein [Bacteroidales bacterium]HQL70609.1 Ig-like domain-containing protein [Bacteroidales bacterium]
MRKFVKFFIPVVLLAGFFMISGCDPEEPVDGTEYALLIQNGAMNIYPDETVAYNAVLVDEEGIVTAAAGVTWSVTPTSVATISSAGVLSPVSTGTAKVKATLVKDGKTLTSEVPVGIYAPALFAVAPSAILYEAGYDFQLETVYFTTGAQPSYSYTSSNTAVATVSSTGLVHTVGVGECTITVTASTMQDKPFIVPVMVIAPPTVQLPVTRVEVSSSAADLFKNETLQLTATAYNPDGPVNNATIEWFSENTAIATVNANGLVTPVQTGETYIVARCNGVFAKCELLVNPDTVVIVTPFYVDLNQGAQQQFTAVAYHNTRQGLTNTYPINFSWEIPSYGPGFEMFDIGTVSTTGLVTIKQDAMIGMASMVIAYETGRPHIGGGALIMIGYGMPWPK